MTREEIIRMAEESELWAHKDREYAAIERFANLVAAAVLPKESLAEMFEWGKDAGRREEREAIEQKIHKLDITLNTRLYVINKAIRSLNKQAEQNGEEL
jgi:hypothetical protein